MLLLSAAACSFHVASHAATSARFDADAYRWAQGRVIDTVYVYGNTRVKTIAILRELESRPGQPLDAVAVDRDQRYLGDLNPFATVAIHVEPGDLRLRSGRPLLIHARVSGASPSVAPILELTGPRSQRIPMKRAGASNEYAAFLESVTDSFKYKVTAG